MSNGRRFGEVSLLDDCMRDCLTRIACASLSGVRVAREQAALGPRGIARTAVSDDGPTCVSNAILTFAENRKIDWQQIAPREPTRAAFIEGFNGLWHDESLKNTPLPALNHARAPLAA